MYDVNRADLSAVYTGVSMILCVRRKQMKLLGLAEIAEIFGVTRQVVANWKARKPTFPKPVAELKSGPVWQLEAIVTWQRRKKFRLRTSRQVTSRRKGLHRDAQSWRH